MELGLVSIQKGRTDEPTNRIRLASAGTDGATRISSDPVANRCGRDDSLEERVGTAAQDEETSSSPACAATLHSGCA